MQSTRAIVLRIFMTLMLLVAGGAPAVADPDKDEAHGKAYREKRDDRKDREGRDDRKPYEGRDDREYSERRDDRRYREGRSYFHQHGYTQLDIPPGHLPPPGECRLWYPGQPPGVRSKYWNALFPRRLRPPPFTLRILNFSPI